MTHSPPIPQGNQSPYPIKEPPHRHASLPPVRAEAGEEHGVSTATATAIGAAVVAGIGAAAAAAAYFLSIRKTAGTKPRSRRRKAGKAAKD